MKDILVHLDGGAQMPHRLDLSIDLAKRENARLIGLFAQSETDAPSIVARRPGNHLEAAAQHARALFRDRTNEAGLDSKWWRLDHGEGNHVVAETVFCARYADLTILGQWRAETGKVPENLVEQVVLNSGRPVLILPETGPVTHLGERIALAWNGSREASRALHDAMPFLERAVQVDVLSIRDAGVHDQGEPENGPKVDIVDHLLRHGVKARSERLVSEELGVMDVILSRVFDLGSDLLVMGAHSGLGLSFLRGGGTRFMLRHQTLPVLMSS
ncbi:universal stress protein [Telmatospirillum siberiense]|uniref:Universal stress protein n=1 Tax=Telmatospirillum siberiense TaxID=382514 RepID=A0A2N3PYG7_9PROT|nr:universal stress protein [Telmatospirillum siberiense]PKU25415.1 universal stress protein [Telmatospirillum siberiense]